MDEIHAVADDKRGAHLALSLERLGGAHGRPTVGSAFPPRKIPSKWWVSFWRETRIAATMPTIVQIGTSGEWILPWKCPGANSGRWPRTKCGAKSTTGWRAGQPAPLDAGLREHAPAGRAGGNASGRAAGQGRGSGASRKPVAKTAAGGGEPAEIGRTARSGGHGVAGTGNRHWHVDLVCQIGSTRSIAVALQRIGRAGHWRGAVPKGRIFVTTRDELLECAALVRAMRQRDLDRLKIPEAPLDILAQQIVAMCSAEDWNEDEFFATVRRAYPYRNLQRADFDAIVEMLSEGIAARRGRYAAYLHRDQVNQRLRGRRGRRLAAITSGGAIPENALYTVVALPEDVTVGTVDEDFAVESLAGDIILLGNTSWRIRRVRSGTVLVEDAKGAAPSVPFWRGEAPGRTQELSATGRVARKGEPVERAAGPVAGRPGGPYGQRRACGNDRKWAAGPSTEKRGTPGGRRRKTPGVPTQPDRMAEGECGVDDAGAEQVVEYILAGRAVLGTVPTQTTVIAERFFDESGGMQLVIHAPFGARINKAWGLALRKRFCRSFNFELQAAATDNGLNISLAEQHSFPLRDVVQFPAHKFRAACAGAGGAGFAALYRALAVGCGPRAGAAALPQREKGSSAHSTHARGRSAGLGFPGGLLARKTLWARSRFRIIR